MNYLHSSNIMRLLPLYLLKMMLCSLYVIHYATTYHLSLYPFSYENSFWFFKNFIAGLCKQCSSKLRNSLASLNVLTSIEDDIVEVNINLNAYLVLITSRNKFDNDNLFCLRLSVAYYRQHFTAYYKVKLFGMNLFSIAYCVW